MTKTRTANRLELPLFGGTTRAYSPGTLTRPQVETLRSLAAEPGIVFHTHGQPTLKSGKQSRWTVLVSRDGKLSPVVIEPDGTRSR